MSLLFSLLIASLSGAVTLLPFFLLFGVLRRKRGFVRQPSKVYSLMVFVFCCCAICIFHLTGIPSIYHLHTEINLNVIPFSTLRSNYMQYVLNLLLFLPFGFLLPLLWKPYRALLSTVCAGFSLSLFIELFQLFNYRATDVDDLIMNTAGTLLGYCLFLLLRFFFPRLLSRFPAAASPRGAPYAYLFLSWLSMFFLQPPLAEWVWNLMDQYMP